MRHCPENVTYDSQQDDQKDAGSGRSQLGHRAIIDNAKEWERGRVGEGEINISNILAFSPSPTLR
jgi:hypothetical protein